MKGYIFTIALRGDGNTADIAWADAVDAFIQDPGPTPDDPEFIQEMDEEEE